MKKLLISTAVLLVLFTACHEQHEEQSTTASAGKAPAEQSTDMVQLTPQQLKNAGLETGLPVYREMHAALKVNGTIEVPPEDITSVSMPIGGYVKHTALIVGMFVSKGSRLATLEDQQYIQLQQDYLTGKSRLQYLEADYIRQKGLNATKATSDKLFQQSLNEYSSQQILVRSLAEKLRLIGLNPNQLTENNLSRAVNLYAPISGFVTRINVNTGKYVTPADVLFELTNAKNLHASLTVFENDASKLKTGQQVTLTSNSKPDQKYRAIVHLIAPGVDGQRSVKVHCDVEKPAPALLPGTFINAEIHLNSVKTITVPDDAIVKWENKEYVFAVKGKGRFLMVNVQTGSLQDGFTAITSAMDMKQPIVLKNAYAVLTKLKNGGEE